MRGSRNVATVLKVRLATIRTQAVDSLIFAVEGPEDKVVYFHWLRQVAPLLKYEVLVCDGKAKLLALRELMQRDLGLLKKGLYFLVDHDFDGLRGQPMQADVYLTDTYAVENHLVTEQTLEDLLRVELHCDGEPGVRGALIVQFRALYEQFLDVTSAMNHRIFVAKRSRINSVRPWPEKINHIAIVALDNVAPSDFAVEALVCLEREPTVDEINAISRAFLELDRKAHYRGKFAFSFFIKYLQLLADDRAADSSKMFSTLPPRPISSKFSFETIASKSVAPGSFVNFIKSAIQNLDEPPLVAA